MTNTEAQQVLGTMLMRYDLTDAELEAIGMAGEALEDDWISVEERLPEYDEEVLIISDGSLWLAWRNDGDGDIFNPYPHWESEECCFDDDEVVYWMPVPKWPEVE